MKIAIPVESESGVDSPVSDTLERTRFFAIVELKEEGVEAGIFENPTLKDGNPGLIPELLSAYGVKKVFVKSLGTRLRILLEHYRIDVLEGNSETLGDAIEFLVSSNAFRS